MVNKDVGYLSDSQFCLDIKMLVIYQIPSMIMIDHKQTWLGYIKVLPSISLHFGSFFQSFFSKVQDDD